MYDIAVIGGGPAGLSAAIQARARNKSVLVVSGDDRDNPLYKTSRIDNYLGFYNVTGPELLERFRTHAGQMGVERRDGRVLNLLAVASAARWSRPAPWCWPPAWCGRRSTRARRSGWARE